MVEQWIDLVPELADFSQAADPAHYMPVPDDWSIGVSDVVNSTTEIEAGRYKNVNLAGAGTISAVANALGGHLPLFIFGGDGARMAVPPDQAETAAEALSRAAMWARRDLGLDLRVGMVKVEAVRAAGFDVRAAFWRASDHVRYAMFAGGGMEWVEAQLKKGAIELPPATTKDDPDLSGLSCQWGPIVPSHGKILSLIAKPVSGVSDSAFVEIASRIISVLEEADALSPVPVDGPEVRWPSATLSLQSRVAHQGWGTAPRLIRVLLTTVLMWLVFRFNIRVGTFVPKRYRREVAINTDFRKFDDGLLMTLDCSAEVIAQLRAILDEAAGRKILRYGIHVQDEALMTCIAPSVLSSDHMHFVDGASGGYAAAAQMLSA